MKIAILGTRGIPNRYGGFEQFAEYLAFGLQARGHEVAVYLPEFHPFKESELDGVTLIRKPCPERLLGPAANFLYDYLCLKDAVRRRYDLVLECGYGTASPSYPIVPLGRTKVVTNMDGLEWKRSKWSPAVQRLTRWTEALAVRRSHALVADNLGIQEYLTQAFGVQSHYIPYGADPIAIPDADHLGRYEVATRDYALAIARLEPENNLEMLIDGYMLANPVFPLLIVGNHLTPYGKALQKRCNGFPAIRFLGGIYDKPVIDTLRHHALLYFHGHSVGGTNPSLLEAMACGSFIAAHDNTFNRSVVGENALYFTTPEDIRNHLVSTPVHLRAGFVASNLAKLESDFSWRSIIDRYEALFQSLLA
jgi:glycosyltransferase involved in cell wall biosynthesis